MNLKNSIIKYINLNLVLFFFGIIILLPGNLKNIPIFVGLFYLMSSLFDGLSIKEAFIQIIKYNKSVLFLFLIFCNYLLSLLWTDNLEYGLTRIETALPLLLLFLISLQLQYEKLTSSQLTRFNNTFILSNIIYIVLFCFYIPFYNNIKYQSFDFNFFRATVSSMPYLGIDPIYISLVTCISIFLLWKSNLSKKIKIPLLLFLLLFLLVINSKSALLSIIIVAFFSLKKKRLIIVFVFSLVMIFFYTRFNEVLDFQTYFDDNGTVNFNNSTNIRIVIWKVFLSNLIEIIPFGVGIGDGESFLNQSYYEYLSNNKLNNYNTHNQFFGILLTSGFTGLLFLLYILFNFFVNSIKKNNKVIKYLFITFLVHLLTENILERQLGVILFSFFITIYSLHRNI